MNSPSPGPKKQVLRLSAAAILDPVEGESGCCLLAEKVDNLSLAWRLLAIGSPELVRHHPAFAYAAPMDCPDCVIFPGLVNAHTHLDLTHLGPRPHDPDHGFVRWVDMVRSGRRADDEGIAQSVRQGIALSLAGGTVAVGDVAGSVQGRYSLAPWRAVRESGLLGVSFVECFGIGRGQARAAAAITAFVVQHAPEFAASQPGPARLGFQPHAPNTVAPPHYQLILDLADRFGAPACTHLAETMEEREFIAHARGGQRQLLETFDLWEDSILEHVGHGLHPIRHLEPVLARRPILAAHCNDCPDEGLEILARTRTSVAYCPRASEYFGVHRAFGPHRYRDMLAAGINVCLGTDSLVNLPAAAADPSRDGMSVLDEMRLLHRRDRTPGDLLLRMATVNGAAALGLDASLFRLTAGSTVAGLLRVHAPARAGPSGLDAALMDDTPAQLLR